MTHATSGEAVNRGHLFRRLMVIVLAIGLLAACTSSTDTSTTTSAGATTTAPDGTTTAPESTTVPTETTSDTTAAPASGGTLRARFNDEPTLLDPAFITNLSDYITTQIVYEGLVALSPEGGEPALVLAETYDVSDDGLRVDFTLKQGVQFHGGYGEVTAEDVKFSLERAAGIIPSSSEPFSAPLFAALDNVEVTGTYSGIIWITEPSVSLMTQGIPEVTGSIISKKAFDELGEEGIHQTPIGTGPYQLSEWRSGESVTFARFDDYGGSAPYVPEDRFDEIVFQIIGEDNAAELAYEAGDLDFVAIRPASSSRFEGFENTSLEKKISMGYSWIGMNVLDPALSNENLRLAIRSAIDVPSINIATSEGQDVIPVGLVAPSSPLAFWSDAPVHGQDMAEAQRLVQLVPEAERTIKFTVGDDETSRTVAQIAAENLEEAGLTVNVEILDAASFFVTGPENRERQLFYTGYGVATYADPSQELVWFTCEQVDVWNYMNWCNEDYDRLFAEATAELETGARAEKYIEMQRLWDEAAHTVWIAHNALIFAYRNDVVAPSISPSGTVFYQAASPAG